jgi:hypothetical protein
MKRNIQRVFILLGFLTTQTACSDLPKEYSAEAIEAWVIEADSEKPLEGVIVTANWQLFHSTVGGRVLGSQLMVMEAVTDKNGRFHFPAWGPKKVPKHKPQKGDVWIAHIPFLVPDAYLDNYDPQLLFFKPGYEYQRLANEVSSKTNMASLRRSEWSGKTIELKKFKGTGEEYAEHVHQLDNDLEWARYGLMGALDDCEWKKIPRMLVELHRLGEQFTSQGVKLKGWQIGARIRKVTDVGDQDKCGPAGEFFRSYLK